MTTWQKEMSCEYKKAILGQILQKYFVIEIVCMDCAILDKNTIIES